MHLIKIITVYLLLIPCFINAEDIHKWRDDNGKIHFGDKPPSDVKSELITVKPNVYETPNIENLSAAFSTSNKVVMYSATWCGYCKKARNYFKANNIPFSEYDVENSKKGKRDYKKLGAKGVPVILVGKERMNGFSVASFESMYKKIK